jgi:hypothetical protein
MAAPLDAPWNTNTLSDAILGEVTVGKGTSDPTTWEVGRMFLRTDTGVLSYNSGTEGTPVWTAIGGDSTTGSTTPVTVTSDAALADGAIRLGNQEALPTAHKYYKITDIEWDNGGTVSGNIIGGACIVDADPVVNTGWFNIANTAEVAQTGANAVQKVAVANSLIVGGGTKITGWLMADNATGQYGRISPGTINVGFNVTSGTVPPVSTAAWLTANIKLYVKIYYIGYD